MKNTKKIYNIEYFELDDNLENIQIGKYHYSYKTIDFMCNCRENTKKLFVPFHSTVEKHMKFPMFYKHDFYLDNFSVLCISDKLLEENRDMMCCCYYGTTVKKYNEYYIEIILSISKLLNIDNHNIFLYGSCGAGYPALYYGSLLHSTIIVANPMIYIKGSVQYNFLKKEGDFYDINEIIINNKPNFIYIYSNTCDMLTINHVKKFDNFCKKNIENNYKISYFEEKESPHYCYNSCKKSIDEIILDIL
jgi:hypothetical protein